MAKKILIQLTEAELGDVFIDVLLYPVIERCIKAQMRKRSPISASTVADDALERVNCEKALSNESTSLLHERLRDIARDRLAERWGL